MRQLALLLLALVACDLGSEGPAHAPDASAAPDATPDTPVESVIRVRAYDRFGEPLPGARVIVHHGIGLREERTNADGEVYTTIRGRTPVSLVQSTDPLQLSTVIDVEPGDTITFGAPRQAAAPEAVGHVTVVFPQSELDHVNFVSAGCGRIAQAERVGVDPRPRARLPIYADSPARADLLVTDTAAYVTRSAVLPGVALVDGATVEVSGWTSTQRSHRVRLGHLPDVRGGTTADVRQNVDCLTVDSLHAALPEGASIDWVSSAPAAHGAAHDTLISVDASGNGETRMTTLRRRGAGELGDVQLAATALLPWATSVAVTQGTVGFAWSWPPGDHDGAIMTVSDAQGASWTLVAPQVGGLMPALPADLASLSPEIGDEIRIAAVDGSDTDYADLRTAPVGAFWGEPVAGDTVRVSTTFVRAR